MKDAWDEEDRARARPRRKNGNWMLRIGGGLGLLVFAALVAWGALALMHGGKTTKKQVVQISLLKPPPPPPPPPPPQKMPEPEVPKEEVKMPEPEQQPQPAQNDAPPPGEQLGLDAEGSGNGDGFGLAARKGGTDIRLGGGGSLGRDQNAWFGGLVQSHLQSQFLKNEKLRAANYNLQLRVWFSADGRIERFELASSTGDREIDESIKVAMDHMPPMRQSPPPNVAQPVRLQITSRGAG